METIITKTIICSGVLLGLYYLILAKEKTLVFNRFYLIFSLIFSICIPFLTIERPQPEEKTEIIFAQETTEQVIINQPNTEQIFDVSDLILLIYFAVATLFLAKFVYSLIKIKTLKGQKTIYKSRKVFLLEKDLAPFSFWNTIYVSRKDFTNGEINHNIFLHEEIHIRQKHSIDVLLTELLKIIFWFNPFIYFYKKAIITNHEFLADEGVIQQNRNIKTYQELILNEILKQQNPALVHPFNFNNTKNRFIMMTKQNSKFAVTKKFLTIPALTIAGLVFAEKTYRSGDFHQKTIEKEISSLFNYDDPYTEYNNIIKKYGSLLEQKRYAEFHKAVTISDRAKLKELYFKLNKEQRDSTPLFFLDTPNKFTKQEVTQSQLDDFMNSEKYGLWIDGKKTKNQNLKVFKPGDFSHQFVSKRLPNAISEKNPEPFQVNMMTNEYFEKYLKEETSVHMSFKIKGIIKGKDTIRPQKTVEAKVTEVKPSRNNEKTVTDMAVATAVPDQGQEKTPAEFPGGMNDFRRSVGETFNHSTFENKSGFMSTAILVSIDENGKTTDVKANGDDIAFNNEAIRTVKYVTNNKTWKPATENGKPVKSVFKLPLKMQFATSYPVKTQ